MGMGKQGGKAAAPVSKAITGKKPGGKVVGGGMVKSPAAAKGFKGNPRKAGKGGK